MKTRLVLGTLGITVGALLVFGLVVRPLADVHPDVGGLLTLVLIGAWVAALVLLIKKRAA